ncbi:MAG: AzlC family ABC transporter permease [Azospirillaceae bacterium]
MRQIAPRGNRAPSPSPPPGPSSPAAGPLADAVAGIAAIAPVVVAALPIGLVFGALAGQAGLGAGAATGMSAVVFAGASQFVALEQWADPLPVASILLATLLVNLRHVAMGAALAPRLGHWPVAARPAALLFMTDEVWAIALARAAVKPLTPAFYAGLAGALWLAWVGSTAAGHVAGALVADPARWGLDLAITAVFIALLRGAWRGPRDLAPWAASAVAAVAVDRAGAPAMAVAAGIVAGLAVVAARILRGGEG